MLKCEHCESAALATRDAYEPVARGKEVHAKRREWQRQSLRTSFAPPGVGEEAGGCRHADEPFDSSHARRGERNRWPLDAAGHSPGAAFWSHCLAHSPLLAQRTGAATANAGRIHHTQASIGFSAS